MSSIMDSGASFEAAYKAKQTPCPKSKDKKHEFERKQQWPSAWDVCKHCGLNLFWK